jgi:hypothetical protein
MVQSPWAFYYLVMQNRLMVIEQLDEAMVAMLRRKTPEQRLAASFDMWRFASDRLNCMLRAEHPNWSDEQLRAEFRRRMLGSA